MNLKYLQDSFTKNKAKFNLYIDNIKRNSPKDIFTIINPTIIKNPYISVFPILFFIDTNIIDFLNKNCQSIIGFCS